MLSSGAQSSEEPTSRRPGRPSLARSLCPHRPAEPPWSPPWSRGYSPGARDSRPRGRPRPGSRPTPPARDRRLGSRWAGDPRRSRAASAQQGDAARPAGPLAFLVRPRTSSHPRGSRGPAVAAPEVLRSSALGPGGPSWLRRVNPLHAAVLHRFRYRRGEAAGISNKTQELVCDSSARIPPVPKLSSRSFLGRSCPMFEPLLPREDGLKAASWGLFLVKEPLYFKGGDGACTGLSSCPIEELLMMFTGYA